MELVDGGYISWVFGSNGRRMSAWNTSAGRFRHHLFVMDHPDLLGRKSFFPDYKSRRAERHLERPEIKARVKNFQEVLWEDETIKKVSVSGLEADDVIAALAVELGHVTVTGVDKDLLQLGEQIALRKHTGEYVSLEALTRKAPKAIGYRLKFPEDVVLFLTLMGDKSDSIPRLIPPGLLGLFHQCYEHEQPFVKAAELFGTEAVLTNFYLTKLPGPWCYDPIPTPEEFMAKSMSGEKMEWSPAIRSILDEVTHA